MGRSETASTTIQPMMSDDPNRRFVYRIDAVDVISDVDDAWVEFAQRNEAESLTRTAVVGSSLWTHVSGVETRHLYRHLFAQVRTGREITIPFRCDSPTVRRFHEMRMTPLPAGGIELACELLREERRTQGPAALLEKSAHKSGEFIVMCSWCKKINVPQNGWMELEQAVQVMQLLSESPLPAITHAICE